MKKPLMYAVEDASLFITGLLIRNIFPFLSGMAICLFIVGIECSLLSLSGYRLKKVTKNES